MTPKQWMFDPNLGGIKIPPAVQADVEKRICAIAEKEFKGKYTRLEIRFKNQFCTLTRIPSPFSPMAGLPQIGMKLVKNMPNACAILPTIFVVCGILAATNGVLLFIHTAMRNMNYPCMMMVNSQAGQNGLF